MKKKIATMLLAFAIFLPCIFVFTACGNDDDPGSAKATSIVVELVSTDYSMTDNAITIPYGVKIELDESDFKVIATMDNDKTKVIPAKTGSQDGYILESTIPTTGDVTALGEYTITFSYPDVEDVVVNVNVVKADVDMSSVRWDYTQSFTYDKSEKEVKLTGLPDGVEVQYQGTTRATNAGEYTATAIFTYADTENYNAIPNMVLPWEIEKADIVISSLDSCEFTFNGTEQNAGFVTTGLPENVSIKSITGEAKATNAGTYPVVVSFEYTGEDADNYNPIADLATTWTINPSKYMNVGTLSFNVDEFVYDGTEKTVVLNTANLDENVEISSVTGLTGKDVDVYEVVVTLAYIGSDSNYNSASEIRLSWEITPATLTVTAKDNTITYGDVAINDGVTYSGFVNGENSSVLVGTLAYGYGNYSVGSDTGTYDITPSGLSANNYLINYVNGTLTVEKASLTVKANNVTIDYNTVATNNGVEVTGLAAGDILVDLGTVNFDFDGYAVGSSVGEYDITPSGLDDTNYDIEYQQGVLTVTTIDVDVDTSVIELKDDTLTYTGSKLAVEVDETTLPSGVSVSNIVIRDAEPIIVGEYTAVIYLQYEDTINYNPMEEIERTWNIEKAVVGTFDNVALVDNELVYNGLEQTVEITGIPAGAKIDTITGNKSTVVGNNMVEVTFVCEDTHNYHEFETVTKQLTWNIIPATLTVTANDNTITYDEIASNNGYVVTGFVNNELEADVVSGTAEYTYGTYTAGSNVGEYDIVVSGLTADNYAFNYVKGILTVEALKVDVSGVAWPTATEYRYNTTEIKPELVNLPVGVTASYTYSVENPIDLGDYTANAVLTATNNNYELVNNNGVAEYAYTIIKGQIDLAGLAWDVIESREYDYTGSAIKVTLNKEIEHLTVEYIYQINSVIDGWTVIDEPIELGQYQVMARFVYDIERFELINQATSIVMVYRIVPIELEITSLEWTVDAALEDEDDSHKTYRTDFDYTGTAYTFGIKGDNLDKLNITYSVDYGSVYSTEEPSITDVGYYYIIALIEVKEEYAEHYYLPYGSAYIYLNCEIIHNPFTTITYNSQEITYSQLLMLNSVEYGSTLSFVTKEGYKVVDRSEQVIDSIEFNNFNEGYYYDICTTENEHVNSLSFYIYILDEITVGDEEIENPTGNSIEYHLDQGETSITFSYVDSNKIVDYSIFYKIDGDNETEVTNNEFVIDNADEIENCISIYIRIDENTTIDLLYVYVIQHSPVAGFVVNYQGFDGNSGEIDIHQIQTNSIVTGIEAISADDMEQRYTNVQLFTDSELLNAIDLTDLGAYSGRTLYVAVYDDENNFICTKEVYINYSFGNDSMRFDINSWSNKLIYNVGDADSFAIELDNQNADLMVSSKIDGKNSLSLTSDITNATYRLEIEYNDETYYYEVPITIIKSLEVEDVADDPHNVYITNIQNSSSYYVDAYQQTIDLYPSSYNAGNISEFENELDNLEFPVAEGLTVTNKELIVVNGEYFVKFTIESDIAMLSTESTEYYLILKLLFNGTVDSDTSATITIEDMSAGESVVTTDTISIDISTQGLRISLNNMYATAVITNSEGVELIKSENGYFSTYRFNEAGTYYLVITATDGTAKTYTITVTGTFTPILEVVVGDMTLTQVVGPRGPEGDFDYIEKSQTVVEFKGYIGNEAINDVIDGKLTITSFTSSMLDGVPVYDQDDEIIDVGNSFDLTVLDASTEMPYVMFYAAISIESFEMRANIYIYLCEKPASDGDDGNTGTDTTYTLFSANYNNSIVLSQYQYQDAQGNWQIGGDFEMHEDEGYYLGYLGASVNTGETTLTFVSINIPYVVKDAFDPETTVSAGENVTLTVGEHNGNPCVGLYITDAEAYIYMYLLDNPNAGGNAGQDTVNRIPDDVEIEITIGDETLNAENFNYLGSAPDEYFAYLQANTADVVDPIEWTVEITSFITNLEGPYLDGYNEELATEDSFIVAVFNFRFGWAAEIRTSEGIRILIYFADSSNSQGGGNSDESEDEIPEELSQDTVFTITIGTETLTFAHLTWYDGAYMGTLTQKSSDLVDASGKISATLTTSLTEEFEAVSGETFTVTPNVATQITIESEDGMWGFAYHNATYFFIFIFADTEL